jgi:hypothetical protein
MFKTEDKVTKKIGDAYYCIQDGSKCNHYYPFTIQLIKIENKTSATSKREHDSRIDLSDSGIKRFHNKKIAKAYLKYLKLLHNKI